MPNISHINNKAIMLWECSEFHQFTSAFGDLLSKNLAHDSGKKHEQNKENLKNK